MSIGELKGVANSPSDSDTTFIPFMLRYKPAHEFATPFTKRASGLRLINRAKWLFIKTVNGDTQRKRLAITHSVSVRLFAQKPDDVRISFCKIHLRCNASAGSNLIDENYSCAFEYVEICRLSNDSFSFLSIFIRLCASVGVHCAP